MNGLYGKAVRAALRRAFYLRAGLAAAFILAALAAVVWGACTPPDAEESAALCALTAACLSGAYITAQKRLIPLRRAMSLAEELAGSVGEEHRGTSLGYKEGFGYKDSVQMRRLLLDDGTAVRRERVVLELDVPAFLSAGAPAVGAELAVRIHRNVVTAWDAPAPGVSWRGVPGRRLSALVLALLCAAAAVGWWMFYDLPRREPESGRLDIAVCTVRGLELPAGELADELGQYGIGSVHVGEAQTGEPAETAEFLATWAAFEADILLLDADVFASVFRNEAAPLPAGLAASLGTEPAAYDEAGRATALALPGEEDVVLAVNALSDRAGTPAAEAALRAIWNCFLAPAGTEN